MAINLSDTCRHNHLDNIETLLIAGGAPKMRFLVGTKPSSCGSAETGALVVEMTLPADPFAAAGSPTPGTKNKQGTWSVTVTGAGGTIGYFRLVHASGTPCILQGTVAQASGGDLNLDNNVLATNQVLTITQFDLTAGNA